MNNPFEFLMSIPDGVIVRLGWVLLHSLWQFTLVGIAAAAVLIMLGRSSANRRCGVLVWMLALSASLPVATWMMQGGGQRVSPTHATPVSTTAESLPIAATLPGMAHVGSETTSEFLANGSKEDPVAERISENAMTPRTRRLNANVESWLPWVVMGWLLGAVVCSLRPLLGWRTLRRLKRVGVAPATQDATDALDRVAQRMQVRRAVAVIESSLAHVPLVVGYMHPTILLPIGLISNISLSQLEAILAHELAHIRRHDFVVNLLQVLVETLCFYHPAIWWISRRIRIEREFSCDDLAVGVMGNRTDYGRALIAVEELRGHALGGRRMGKKSVLSVAASDGALLERIRRIAGERERGSRFSASTAMGLFACLVLVAGALTWTDPAEIVADDRPQLDDDPLPAGSKIRFGTSRFRFGIPISNMAVSPDESIAVVANDNHAGGKTRVFDLRTGRVLYTIGAGIEAAALSPDGKTIVTKGNFIVTVRDAATGKELHAIALPRFNRYSRNEWVVVTPDGKSVAVTSQGSVVHLIDLVSGEIIREFSNENPESTLSESFQTVLGIAFSADGRLLATGGFANDKGTYFARLWDVATGKEIRRFVHTKRSYGIPSLAFSADAKWLATRSHDGQLRVFDVQTGEIKHTFVKDGGGRRLGTVAFSPDGKTVVAAGDSIRFYDVQTGEERLRIDASQACNLRFTDGGRSLTAGVLGAIVRWDTATGKALTPDAGASSVAQILVTPDGKRLLTRGYRGDTSIWDTATGKPVGRVQAGRHRDVAVSPDGRFVVWAVGDGSIQIPDAFNSRLIYHGARIQLWDIASGQFVDRFKGFKGDADSLAFSADGQKLVTVGHRDGVVRVWNFANGEEEKAFQAVPEKEREQSRQVARAAMSPDGTTLVIAYTPHEDIQRDKNGQRIDRLGRVLARPRPTRMWDIRNGKLIRVLKGARGAMAFSPDGKLFVTASGTVVSTASGERVAVIPSSPGIRSLAFSPDGHWLATGVSGKAIHIWNAATWQKHAEFQGHRDGITGLAFGPDGRLYSGSADTTALGWDFSKD